MKTVELSARMQALVDLVSKGKIVCDIGCDHGFVSIYLVQQKIAPRVYAMDVRTGPLERAKEHIREYGLENYIETRLSDGLAALKPGEADCMICAGMGGPLMMKILEEGRKKAGAMSELILQPQSEVPAFRSFLRKEGYKVVDENMIYEDGKYYPMMKAVPVCKEEMQTYDLSEEEQLMDMYGEILLKKKHPVLEQYLAFQKNNLEELSKRLSIQGGERAIKRAAEVNEELHLIQKALAYMKNV